MDRPTQIRADFVLAEARKLRQEFNLCEYVDIEKIIKSQKNIRLMYSFDADSPFTVKVDRLYMIILHPTLTDAEDRLIICQGFARIVLKHYEDYPSDVLISDVHIPLLTDEERHILDCEADIFASEFLAPRDLVIKFYNSKPSYNVGQLAKRFGVPEGVILKTLDGLIKKPERIKLTLISNRR